MIFGKTFNAMLVAYHRLRSVQTAFTFRNEIRIRFFRGQISLDALQGEIGTMTQANEIIFEKIETLPPSKVLTLVNADDQNKPLDTTKIEHSNLINLLKKIYFQTTED